MKRFFLGTLLLSATFSFAQTKKILIEEVTGLNCPTCPFGTLLIDTLHTDNKANSVLIIYHGTTFEPQTSSLRSTDADNYIDYASVPGAPVGMIDRFGFGKDSIKSDFPDDLGVSFNTRKNNSTAIASIGFENKQYNSATDEYSTDIVVEFTSLPKSGVPIKIQVQVLEDSIAAVGSLEQRNSVPAVGSMPIIKPWWHNHTFRKSLIGPDVWGDANTIPAVPKLNTKYTYQLKFKMDPSWNKDQVHLVALVAFDNTKDKEVINAEEALNVSKTFMPLSIKGSRSETSIGVYPNPATVNTVVKVQYVLKESSKVAMNIYSVTGQLIGEAYQSSYETSGSHVINWQPSSSGLVKSIYLLEIVTDNNKQYKQIVVE